MKRQRTCLIRAATRKRAHDTISPVLRSIRSLSLHGWDNQPPAHFTLTTRSELISNIALPAVLRSSATMTTSRKSSAISSG